MFVTDQLIAKLTHSPPSLLTTNHDYWTNKLVDGLVKWLVNLLLSDSLSIHDCLTDRNGWLTDWVIEAHWLTGSLSDHDCVIYKYAISDWLPIDFNYTLTIWGP